jgi:hypothetical protein
MKSRNAFSTTITTMIILVASVAIAIGSTLWFTVLFQTHVDMLDGGITAINQTVSTMVHKP